MWLAVSHNFTYKYEFVQSEFTEECMREAHMHISLRTAIQAYQDNMLIL